MAAVTDPSVCRSSRQASAMRYSLMYCETFLPASRLMAPDICRAGTPARRASRDSVRFSSRNSRCSLSRRSTRSMTSRSCAAVDAASSACASGSGSARARALPEPLAQAEEAASTAAQDRDVIDRVDRLLKEQRLFLDENLTLSRLARRAGVPARQISGAINRLAGKNVSQYINEYRIAEACRLLRQTDGSVTAAMLESGFQTKSNFNREFRRVTTLSPATWRDQNRAT